jgi:erythromycin esterase
MSKFIHLLGCLSLINCSTQVPTMPRPPPSFSGIATYEGGAPAAGALIALTSVETGKQVEVLVTGPGGSFQGSIPSGDYALAVTSDRGFAWVEKHSVPDVATTITLSKTCYSVTGHVDGSAGFTRASMVRKSSFTGDTFLAPVRRNGDFTACLPEGRYDVSLVGDSLSPPMSVALSKATSIRLKGVASRSVHTHFAATERASGDLRDLIADIAAQKSDIIALGEATHGTAEFFTARSTVTLELVRTLGARLVLIEADAIAGVALDDYVGGADVDIAKAIAALGFWTTDTHEFLQFLTIIREHNRLSTDKVHVWGIDAQNTVHPTDVLIGKANELSISQEEQSLLKQAANKHGRAASDLKEPQRATLDALLSRLRTPRSSRREDTLVAVAARSLAIQYRYWEGDAVGEYSVRRDAGMAELARFIASQQKAAPACLWAHDAHVTKEAGNLRLGHYLAAALAEQSMKYYAIGFYMHHGTARAWDIAGKIGVISHPIPIAPEHSLEGAIMSATGAPEVAWIPFRTLPATLRRWLEVPRFVREIGAVYANENDMMILRSVLDAFDAVVVIRRGHDSSPTPTGIRKAP